MNQCFGAVENMFHVKYPPPLTNLKRKSLSDLVDHPSKRQAVMPPVEPPVIPARIQPRPPPPNGYMTTPPISTNSGLTAAGKKRGRPSKADKEAQARANFSRSTEYAPITPAPLAPAVLQPQREYVSSPGYEIASSSVDQRHNKRGRAPTMDNVQHLSGSYPLASPASTTGTPRGLPEPLEHGEKSIASPRDRGSIPIDSRSPPLLPHIQHQDIPHTHSPVQPRQQPPPLLQHSTRPPPIYEPYRGPDPIFPDRDRSRVVSEHPPKTSSPTSISASRA